MKKRILALALAGTTAFSVFGGLNVFAAKHGADTSEEYAAYKPVAEITVDTYVWVGNKYLLDVDYELVMDFDDVMDTTVEDGVVYFYDFLDDLNDALEDAGKDPLDAEKAMEEAEDAYSSVALAKAWVYSIGAEDSEDMVAFETGVGDKKSIRKYVVDAFEDFIDETPLEEEDYTIEEGYNFEGLLKTLRGAADDEAYLDLRTSELVYLMQEYDRMVGEYAELKDIDNTDWADLLVAILEGRDEEDFKTTKAYRAWTADLEDLIEAYEEADTYTEQYNAIYGEKGLEAEVTKKATDAEKADLTELADAIDTTILTDWELYPIADFVDKTSDLFVTVEEDGEDVEYEVTEEYYWYTRVRNLAKTMNANKKTGNYQGSVDVITEALLDAEAALVPTTEPKASRLLSLEEWVDANDDLIEMDYTAKSWAKYVTALEHAEELLAGDPGANQVMDAVEMIWYIDELMNHCDAEYTNPNHVKVKTSQVKAMKAAIKDAEDWLDEYDDTAAVSKVLAVTKALANANEVLKDYNANECVLLSEFLGAIEDIETALSSEAVNGGWLKTADGKWMYGTEDGYLNNGWAKIGAVWYYFDADGTAKESEWLLDNGKWYYFTSGCNAVAANWAQVNGKWYYFDHSCAMVTGWLWNNNCWYYLDASGAMVTDTVVDGYTIGADGVML